jgi:8-oxo-dGTP pyrophosphatase MutT (NUDIX family)
MSKRIEWIAPKGKIQEGETPEKAALREIEEETGLLKQNLQARQKLDTLSLQLYMDDGNVGLNKDVTYFLIQYHGDPLAVNLQDGEGFVGQYVWTDIQRALNLITYRDLRELFRVAFQAIGQVSAKSSLIEKLF